MHRPAVVALAVTAIVAATAASAQERRWELDVYGGAVAVRTATDGKQALPPAGAPLVTSSPIFPSREVPSWLFGDGASLLNGVVEEFGSGGQVVPLDAAFAAAARPGSAAAGLRIRRRASPRVAWEAGIDWLGAVDSAPAGFAAAVESTRASFPVAMRALLATGPFSSVSAEAGASSVDDARNELAATAAFSADIARLGAFTPYVTFGGGVLAGVGAGATAELTAHYRFVVLGDVPIDESERVTVRFERPPGLVAVVGAGLRRDLSERWGLRIDVRALAGPDRARVTVSTETAGVRATPAGFVESFTNPGIQFSNDPATGRRSTLSAPALDAFRVFSGGMLTRTLITVAVSRRF